MAWSIVYDPDFGLAVPKTGLIFPSNDDGGTDVHFRFTDGAMPDITPLTIIWRLFPIQQASYYTTFFHGRTDGGFAGDNTYVGCHPYPDPAPNGTDHNWEIAIDGGDDIVDEGGGSTEVTKGLWYSQAARIANDGVNFYFDLPSTTQRVFNDDNVPLQNASQAPALSFGDAPWNLGNERLSGILRGLIIVQAALSTANINALAALESDDEVVSAAAGLGLSLFYCNINPTPSDISDKSPAGNNPAFVGAGRPTLWEG